MIFDGSEKQDEAWELLKWWMSKETQSDFAQTLQMTYGAEYMWNTANLDAFAELPWQKNIKKLF
ncbi:hypothetical protein [Bacillus sp. JCM 19041]|uniref:hypothetical protein n=1 Tax=Bacillus sp. JCM 19041 TaxID=1460637 RepID=UPI0006D27E97